MKEEIKTVDYDPANHPRTATDKTFRIALYFKALDGLLEIAGGILLLLVNPDQIGRWADRLTQGELSRDPHDFIANHILKSAHGLTAAGLTFGAIYLLVQGAIKLIVVIEVLRNHLWAYIVLIIVLAIFVLYQLYRLTDKLSIGLIFLTIIDLIIIYLTQNEYRKHKSRLTATASHKSA